nr:DUF4003 family protein [Miniphocaeibacter massiliensis]
MWFRTSSGNFCYIAQNVDRFDYDGIVEKTRGIYEKMKRNHPFLTSSEDTTFAAMLAISKLNISMIENEMEKCYDILRNSVFYKNAVQSLSTILSLGEKTSEIKCERVERLYND